MTIQDWKKKNGGNFTEGAHNTHITLFNPSMEDFQKIVDDREWNEYLSEYLYMVVINDYSLDDDGNYSWVFLVSDSGITMNIKRSKKQPDRLIAYSDEYSDKWELIEQMEIDCDRETGVNTFLVKIPSEKEPIKLYMR
jgi:hypothetical protein